jgi:hypothetical protein
MTFRRNGAKWSTNGVREVERYNSIEQLGTLDGWYAWHHFAKIDVQTIGS